MKTKVKNKRTTKVKVVQKPESLVNDQTRILTDASWPVGSAAAQGDLYLVRIEKLPTNAKPRKNRQMAEGDTQGSRHVVISGDCFDCEPKSVLEMIKSACPKAKIEAEFVGPVFSTVNGLAELDHPEHGNYQCEGDMVIAVIVQRNLDAEERAVRSRD